MFCFQWNIGFLLAEGGLLRTSPYPFFKKVFTGLTELLELPELALPPKLADRPLPFFPGKSKF